jgi:hypothetical protein
MNKFNFHSVSYIISIASCIVLIGSSNVYAGGIGAGTIAYPSKGQSQEQTQKDSIDCHNWSVSQAGFDPTRPPPPPRSYNSAPPPKSSGFFGSGETGEGGVMKDAAGGAALGAIGGALTGSVGTGAAIGALAGGLFGGAKRSSRKSEERRWQEQQAQQQAQQQQEHQQQVAQLTDTYRRAYLVCMSSRDYKVQ